MVGIKQKDFFSKSIKYISFSELKILKGAFHTEVLNMLKYDAYQTLSD